jgi:hypothetical protein
MVAQVVSPDNTYSSVINSKYGGVIPWTTATNNRLLSWGFNSLTTGAYLYNLPIGTDPGFPLDSNGLHSQPVKIPFTYEIRPAYYAMTNPVVGNGPLLTNPVKNMIYVHSPYYTGYVPSGGIADYYDAGIGTWLQKDLQTDFAFTTLSASPYQNYVVGLVSDDGDEMYGFGAGPDFATTPPGYNNFNLGMQVATLSPVETANPNLGFVYADTLIHSKEAMRNALASEYGSVAALNAAWGANYTSFDSSGTQIKGEWIGTGDGSNLTFDHQLSHVMPSKFSVQILLNGKPIAGETGSNDLWGPNVMGRVSGGRLMVVFRPGHAPSTGSIVTANYVQNGWGIGTGFMDEDDRPSHQIWMGDDWIAMNNANAQVRADVNRMLQKLADQYFSCTRNRGSRAYIHTCCI